MNLYNGWQEKIEHFNEYAYMEIEKMDTIDSMPVSLVFMISRIVQFLITQIV